MYYNDPVPAKRAVWAIFLLNGGLFGAWASRIPSIQSRFQLSDHNLSFYLLLLAAGAICSFPIAGRLSDRFGAALMAKIVAGLYCPTLVFIGFSSDPWMFGLAIFLFGAGHGATDVAMNGWGVEIERIVNKSMMSSFHAMFSVGAGVGALSGALASYLNMPYDAHFALFGLLAMSLLLFTRVAWQSESSKICRHKGLILPKGGLLIMGLLAAMTALGEGAIADWSALYLTVETKAPESIAALGYVAFSIAMVTMRFLGDQVLGHLQRSTVIQLCGLFSLIGSILVNSAFNVSIVCIGFASMGLGYAVMMPLVFSYAANTKQVSSGVAIASMSTFGYGGMLIGPPFIGILAEYSSLQRAFLIFAIFSIFTVFSSAFFSKDNEAPNGPNGV